MSWRGLTLALVALTACGRVGFAPIGDRDGGGGDDDAVAIDGVDARWTLIQHVAGDPNCPDAIHCAFTVPSTGTGHLLVLVVTANTGMAVSAVTGGGTWIVPPGCYDHISYMIACAYTITSTRTTEVDWTIASTAFHVGGELLEFAYSGGPPSPDAIVSGNESFTMTPAGIPLSGATGASDLAIEAMMSSCGVFSVTPPYASIADFHQVDGLNQFGVAAAIDVAPALPLTWATTTGCMSELVGLAFQ